MSVRRLLQRLRDLGQLTRLASVTVSLVLAGGISAPSADGAQTGNLRAGPAVASGRLSSEVITQTTTSHSVSNGKTFTQLNLKVIATTLGKDNFRAFEETFYEGTRLPAEADQILVAENGVTTFYRPISGNPSTCVANGNNVVVCTTSPTTSSIPAPVRCYLQAQLQAGLNRMCSTTNWVGEIDSFFIGLDNGPSLSQYTGSVYQPASILRGLRSIMTGKLTKIGTARIASVKTTEYREKVNFEKWYHQSKSQDLIHSIAMTPALSGVALDLWIDSKGMLRQIESPLSYGGTVTTTFSDFNLGVVIS